MENTIIESLYFISKAQHKVCRRCVQIQNVIEVKAKCKGQIVV